MRNTRKLGYIVPELLVPAENTDASKWSVIACDQYTSEPERWKDLEAAVGDAPSALHVILPEAYLGEDQEQRTKSARKAMHTYLTDGTLRELPPGAILTERTLPGGVRRGVMLAMDLEAYDFRTDAHPMIRATEKTVVERIPPRRKIREGAPIDLPHVMLLIDDPDDTVIGRLDARKASFEKIYDFELMQGGGHVCGWLISRESDLDAMADALATLPRREGMLYCVGDGNHSLATAKAIWDDARLTMTEEERERSPLRYALCEVVNVHDDAVHFLPIHRVLRGAGPDEMLEGILTQLQAQGADAEIIRERRPNPEDGLAIPFLSQAENGWILIRKPTHILAAGTIQPAIDEYLSIHPEASVDYIHGEESLHALSTRPYALGLQLPAVSKDDFFEILTVCGVMPRKTFSIGEADEKRYYLEGRRLDGRSR